MATPTTAQPFTLQMSDPSLFTGFTASTIRIADRAVVCSVECEGVRLNEIGAPGGPVYDVSAMLDEREHSPDYIDWAREELAYGVARGLFSLLPAPSTLVHVRLCRMP